MCLRRRMLPLSVLFWSLTAAGVCAPPTVAKVEPPDWWVEHTINPVQLLVRGTNLSGCVLSAPGGLSVSRVHINPAGSYLFADLTIPAGQKPGAYDLLLKGSDGSATASFRVNPQLTGSDRLPGFSPSDVVYLLMPDRFANGDPSNDNPPNAPGLFDREKRFFYHGGDFQGIIDHLPYLKELGVTALWMTPIYENSGRIDPARTQQGQERTDYHGYGGIDYYGVNQHFGSLALLQKLVREAHSAGIKVIQDQVENHVGPHHPWMTDPPTPTWFHGTPADHLDENWQIWSRPPICAASLRRAGSADSSPTSIRKTPKRASARFRTRSGGSARSASTPFVKIPGRTSRVISGTTGWPP